MEKETHKGIVQPSNNIWRRAIKRLVDRGDISVEDANLCYKNLEYTKEKDVKDGKEKK